MIRRSYPLFASLLAIASTPAPAQSVRDFQLPPNPSPTPTATPNVQGPVDIEADVPIRPRAIPTATPTPEPSPTAPSTPAAVTTQPGSARTAPAPVRTAAPPPPANRTAPAAPPSLEPQQPSTPATSDSTTPLPSPTAAPEQSLSPPSAASGSDRVETESSDTLEPWWQWPVVLALLAMLAAAAFLLFRRFQGSSVPPKIEKPVVPQSGAATNAVSPGAAHPPLALRPEALRLSRSVMNANLSYRLTVHNRSERALTNVVIEADLGSASGDRPVEEQVSSPAVAREPRHTLPRLSPGQSARFEGQLQLPLQQAGIIRQGDLALLVPLLRLRATADAIDPQARTIAIGQPGAGGSTRLRPFRLDEGLRSYEPLAQRMLD